MTNQVPDILIVDSGAIELPAMELYGIVAGNLDEPASRGPYLFVTKANKAKTTICSALWHGYVSTYRLGPDGSLTLEQLAYPFTRGVAPDEVHEILCGDFWLDLRTSFTGDGVQVPFANGKIIEDQTRWKRREGYDLKRFEKDWDAVNCASLVVSADRTVPHGMQGYKVYIDGNIHGTPPRFSEPAPANAIYTRVQPGAHRVVVREANHAKPDRAESNTLHVQAHEDMTLTLKLVLEGSVLTLMQEAL